MIRNSQSIEQLAWELIRADLDLDDARQQKEATLCETSVLSAAARLFEAIENPDDVKIAIMRVIKIQTSKRIFDDLDREKGRKGWR